MASCPGSTSRTSIFDSFLQIWKEWQITLLMLVTMSLQLLLVTAGFLRKHTSNSFLHSSVWMSFIALDALAAYAIGLMLGSSCDTVFSLWAPILLFHLGAADSVSAYSPADNELWQRHGFKMSLEIIGATYILSRASSSCKFLGAGILLLLVGGFKYGERVYALWCGSVEQVVKSARPIYKFMALDHHHHHHHHDDDASQAPPSAMDSLIVSGEHSWYRSHQGHDDNPFENVVTYDDVVRCRELKHTARYINEVCLAHALFKIYRRRLTNLRIHHKDDDHEKAKKLLFPRGQPSPLRVMSVIDMELSFIYDGVFTKGATGRCYQGMGITTRLLSILLLFIIVIDLLALDASHITCEDVTSVHLAGELTILFVTLAFLLECAQMFKIVRSNWTRVWLACSYIQEKRLVEHTHHHHYRHSFHQWSAGVLISAFRYVGAPSKTHWEERIGQRSIVVDSMNSVCWHYLRRLELDHIWRVKETQGGVRDIVDVDASNVHYHLVEHMAQKFGDVTPHDLALRRDQIARSVRFPFGEGPVEQRIGPEFSPSSDSGLEQAVLNWHLATSVCEMDLILHSVDRQDESVKMSIALSRYCVHLLLAQPKLTPGDPDVCNPMYAHLREELTRVFLRSPHKMEEALLKDYRLSEVTEGGAGDPERLQLSTIDAGIKLGRMMMERWGAAERWKKLEEVWVDILVYFAIAENAHPHTEQLAKGGELLTHLWVLLGHLGFGQKSWISRPHAS